MGLFTTAPASQADIDGAYAWLRMGICVILGTIGGVGMWSVVVTLPLVQEEFGVLRSDASLPYTATMLGFATGNLVFGKLFDRYGSAIPVACAGVMLGAGFILGAASPSLARFTLIHGVLIGLGSSVTFAPLMVDISHWFVRRRGIAVAATASGSYVAGMFWPLVMQPMMDAGGWRWTYVAIGVVCLVTFLPLAAALRRAPPPCDSEGNAAARSAPGTGQLSTGLTARQLQFLLIVAGLSCCIAMSMPQIHIIAYCVDLGHGAARGAEMLALMMGAGVLSRLLSGLLIDHLGGVRTLLLGSIGQLLTLLLYMPFDGLASLYVVSLVFGLSQGGIVPSYAIIIREFFPASEAGWRVGSVLMATIVGMALGGWMNGLIYDLTGSYNAAFLNGIAFNLLNIAVVCLILFSSRRYMDPMPA